MELKIKLQANNCLRISVQTPSYKPKHRGDNSRDRRRESLAQATERYKCLKYEVAHSTNVVYLDGWCQDIEAGREELRRLERLYPTLTSSTNLGAPQSKHSAWFREQAPKEFTQYARQSILEAGTVIDREQGERAALLTLTIPGGTDEALKAVSMSSGWIVDRQLDVIRKEFGVFKGIKAFFVWEFQKRGALHQHWCISYSGSYWVAYNVARSIERMWFKCLWELQDKLGVDCFQRRNGDTWRYAPEKWQSNLQKVIKSVGGYFAKYASKTAKNVIRLNRYKSRRIWYPSRWWGCTSNLKAAIKEWRIDAKVTGLTDKIANKVVRQFTAMLTDVYKPVITTEVKFDVVNNKYVIEHENYSHSFCSGVTYTYYFDATQYPDIWTLAKQFILGKDANVQSRSNEVDTTRQRTVNRQLTPLEQVADYYTNLMSTAVDYSLHSQLDTA